MPTATARVIDVQGNTQLEYTFSSHFYEVDAALGRTCHPIREELPPLVLARHIVCVGVIGLVLAAIPITIVLALGIVFLVFKHSFRFMNAMQRDMFDARYQKID